MTLGPRVGRPLLLACFVLSGGAALLYEVAWLRLLALVFGSTGFAVATVLSVFMAGLALGSYLLGRLADRWRRPLLLFGLLELGLGAYALVTPELFEALVPVYRWAWAQLHPSFFGFSLARFELAFAALLLPTTLMGGTLPALSRFFTTRTEEVGLHKTILAGVAVNGLVGAVAMLLAARLETRPVRARDVLTRDARRSPRARTDKFARFALVIFALSGLLAMSYEVAWTRLLTLILGSSTYAFTVMVTTFVLGIGLGSALMARPADRLASPLVAFGALELAIGLTSFLGLHVAHRLPSAFIWLFHWTGGGSSLFVAGQFLIAGLVMLLPAVCLGAVFPLIVRFLARDPSRLGATVGRAYAANTMGAVLGAFGGGFLLLPLLGIQGTILMGSAVNVLAGAVVLGWAPGLVFRRRVPWVGAAGAALLLMALEAPAWDRLVMSSGVYREAPSLLSLYRSPKDALRLLSNLDLLYYREGVTATVTVVQRPVLEDRDHLALSVDGKVDASTAQDMATQILSAHLPLMLAPRLDRVLIVGWGSGVTVGSALLYPVKELTALEIEAAVVEGSRRFDHVNHRPLGDPRLQLVVDDGRNYLLAAPDTYDVIISEPSNPWMSGPAKLFTREFFQLGAAHLTPDGVFCQWLQTYGLEPSHLRALIRTFQAVFPYVYTVQTADADLILLGSRNAFALDVGRLRRWFQDPAIARDLRRVGVATRGDLLARFRLGPRETAAVSGHGPLNTDDNGLIEFAAPKALYQQTIEANLRIIDSAGGGKGPDLAGWSGPREEAEVLLDLGVSLMGQGRANAAVQALTRSVALVASANGSWLLGDAHSRAGDDREALRAWQNALRLDQHHLPSRLSRARWFMGQARWQDALSELDRATDGHPERATARGLMALAYYAQGRYPEARKALALAPDRPDGRGRDEFEKMFQPYLALRLTGRPAQDASGRNHQFQAFLLNLREWRHAIHWTSSAIATGALDSLVAFADRFFPDDRELRSVVEAELLQPLTAFYQALNAYLLGFHGEAIELLTPLESATGGSLPLASYYLGLAHLGAGQLEAGAAALARFLESVPPERRPGASSADAKARLGAALQTLGTQRERSPLRGSRTR
ncbi:MAG: fused MFS/spermidine synthase [Gemmatimonadetes bacterium]|nr:fused MFS/spermidine synthase [Gemmatimonadota bacterium]